LLKSPVELLLPQAAALPRLCNQLSLADGLRELVLDLDGRAAAAVPAKFASLGRLTQLDSLRLQDIAIDVKADHLIAALSPLTRLTQLCLRFDCDYWDTIEGHAAFPWEEAVCVLTGLQELHFSTIIDEPHSRVHMFKGALPAAISRLTALRRLVVLGMDEWDARDDSDQLLLPALPALETAALRVHTLCGQVPTLCSQQPVIVSRLVSLSLALRVEVDADEPYVDTHIPTIIAPALTELILDDIKLALDSDRSAGCLFCQNCGDSCWPMSRQLQRSCQRASSGAAGSRSWCSGDSRSATDSSLRTWTLAIIANASYAACPMRVRSSASSCASAWSTMGLLPCRHV